MTIMLKNLQRQIQVFNVPATVQSKLGADWPVHERVVTVIDEEPGTGVRRPRRTKRTFAEPLTLLGRETRDDLPDAILEIPEVKEALRARPARLRVLSGRTQPAPPAREKTKSTRSREEGETKDG